MFLAILAAKEGAGRQVMAVDPRNTSRRCPECGHTAHADTVGALNVLRAGLARRDANPA